MQEKEGADLDEGVNEIESLNFLFNNFFKETKYAQADDTHMKKYHNAINPICKHNKNKEKLILMMEE